MHTCIEANEPDNIDKVWVCDTDQFSKGKGIYKQNLIFLKGFSGSFLTKYLTKIN